MPLFKIAHQQSQDPPIRVPLAVMGGYGDHAPVMLIGGFSGFGASLLLNHPFSDGGGAFCAGWSLGRGADLAVGCGMADRINMALIWQIGVYATASLALIKTLSRDDHAGASLAVLPSLADEIRGNLLSITSLTDRVSAGLKHLSTLSRDDHAGASLAVLPSLADEIRGNLLSITSLTDRVSAGLKHLSTLSRDDHAGASLAVLPSLADEIRGNLLSITSLTDRVSAGLKHLSALSRDDHAGASLAVLPSLADEIRQVIALVYSLTDGARVPAALRQTLSGDPAAAALALIHELAAHNDIRVPLAVRSMLDDYAARFITVTAEIYLDGRPLSRRFVSAEIAYDEGSVHNSITIQSADPELFAWADPALYYGQPRIEAQVGGRMMQFLIDTRPGEMTDFTINGISVSALEDAPHAAEMDFTLDAPELASSIAARLTNYCPVDWQAGDWVVPADFTFSGVPLDGIQALASEIGAIVRCQDDGSLLVRKRRVIRPIHADAATPGINYDQTDLISLSQDDDPAAGFNAVLITGRTRDVFIPQMMLEPDADGNTSFNRGRTVYIRVYWAGNPVTVIDTYVTSGLLAPVADGAFFLQTEEALVEFSSGAASVNLPIHAVIGVEWIGTPGGPVSFVPYSRELTIPDAGFAVARIKYQSRYQRYRAFGHNVERLIAVLYLEPAADDVVVDVRMTGTDTADVTYGPPINAPLLTTAAAAVERATAFLDAARYRTAGGSVEAPYNDAAIDGALAYINDDQIGYPGNHYITASRIIFDGPKITNSLRIEKCLTSFNS
jgi:hypothetical protein